MRADGFHVDDSSAGIQLHTRFGGHSSMRLAVLDMQQTVTGRQPAVTECTTQPQTQVVNDSPLFDVDSIISVICEDTRKKLEGGDE